MTTNVNAAARLQAIEKMLDGGFGKKGKTDSFETIKFESLLSGHLDSFDSYDDQRKEAIRLAWMFEGWMHEWTPETYVDIEEGSIFWTLIETVMHSAYDMALKEFVRAVGGLPKDYEGDDPAYVILDYEETGKHEYRLIREVGGDK